MSREDRSSAASTLISALCIAVGLMVGGYFIGKGAARFRSESRTVTVKGLVERDVAADRAVWTLGLRRASDDLREAHEGISADREAVLAFLKAKGFRDEEIERAPTNTIDKLARDYGQAQNAQLRYVVSTSVVVKTTNVDGVHNALGATEELLKVGVGLSGGRDEGHANPRYIVSRFNDLRPQLLAEATKNARTIAEQFAADSGSTVGKIHSANQGMIQIFGSDGNDESAEYSPTSAPLKKIRVVSTVEFELQ